MAYQRIQQPSAWNPPIQAKTSPFAPRPFGQEAPPESVFASRSFGQDAPPLSQFAPRSFGPRLSGAARSERASLLQRALQARSRPSPLLLSQQPLSQQPATEASSESTGNRVIQTKADITENSQVNSDVSRPNKTGLPDQLKTGIEHLSGYSLDNVRVHYNSPKPTQLQALAYTQGTDIHVAPGQERHLPHEGWHVVQQMQGRVKPTMQMKGVGINDDVGLEREADVMGAKAATEKIPHRSPALQGQPVTNEGGLKARSVTDTVQRNVGFEFESQQMLTSKSNTGALPSAGFPNEEEAREVWNDPKKTWVKKGVALLSKPDVEVQADDTVMGGSDLEVVTTHFPLTNEGRKRLEQAMRDMNRLIAAYTRLMPGQAYPVVPTTALHNVANFKNQMNDGMIFGNWATARTAGQVTLGTRLQNVGNLVRDFHDAPGETEVEKAQRDPGRLRMRPPNPANGLEPRPLPTKMSEATTLVNGHHLAQETLLQYQNAYPNAPGGRELEGLLTIIFTYCESMPYKKDFLKNHTPLMAKTNLAVMFSTLPPDVKAYYSHRNWWGVSRLEQLVAIAKSPKSGQLLPNGDQLPRDYAERMGQPLFQGVRGVDEEKDDEKDDEKGKDIAPWYHKLTLRQWLSGIVERKQSFMEMFRWNSPAMRTGTDFLTNATFPDRPASEEIEGYGALGEKMDTHLGTGDALPVFELRSASRPITYAKASQWALDFFDYVRSLNNNPDGGYKHMKRGGTARKRW